MTRDEFRSGILTYIQGMLPAEYANAKITAKDMFSTTNGQYYGLTVSSADKRWSVSPVFNLDRMYEKLKNETLTDALFHVAKEIENTLSQPVPINGENLKNIMGDYSSVKNRLYAAVAPLAYKSFIAAENVNWSEQDILLYPKLLISQDDNGVASISIKKEHLKILNVSAEQLIADTLENTQKFSPILFSEIDKVPYMFEEQTCLLDNVTSADPYGMYVLTNKQAHNGAAALFCEGIKEKLGKLFGQGYYLIPSSINEWLIVSNAVNLTAEELKDMIGQVNETECSKEDVLSDHAYHYDPASGVFDDAKLYELSLQDNKNELQESEEMKFSK